MSEQTMTGEQLAEYLDRVPVRGMEGGVAAVIDGAEPGIAYPSVDGEHYIEHAPTEVDTRRSQGR